MGIRLTWTDPNFGEDGHNIYRSTSPMDPQSLPAPYDTVGPNVELYDDGNVTDGETYYYRVSAFAGSSLELVSDEIQITASTFSPADLFDSSTGGAWYDPSDLSTLFQDDAGTTPVTTDGDLVGRIEDKSGNGNHITQSNSGLRPVYKTDGTLHWIEFSGAHLDKSDMVFHSTPQAWSFFIAMRASNAPSSGEAPFSFGSSSSRQSGIVFQENSGIQPFPVTRPSWDVGSDIVLSNIQYADSSSDTVSKNDGSDAGVASGSLSTATDTYTNPISVGRRHVGDVRMDFRMYGLIIVEGVVGSSDLQSSKDWLNGKCSAY